MESKIFCHDHLHSIDDSPTPLPETTDAEMFVFLAITIQMGNCKRDKLTD